MSNVYAEFANTVANLLIGNIGTLQTHTDTLALWTDTNAALTANWTTRTPDQNWNSEDAGKLEAAYEGVQDDIKAGDSKDAQKDFAALLQNFLNPEYLDVFSQAFGVDLMNMLNNPVVWDKDAGPSQMNVINQFMSLINSCGQKDEQIGQNESKTESSVVQQDAGAQQAIGDMGSTVNGAGGNIAGILQQPY